MHCCALHVMQSLLAPPSEVTCTCSPVGYILGQYDVDRNADTCELAASSFPETAGSLWFCARLLLKFVTKSQKNQKAVAVHPALEPLLRDVLPAVATVEQQLWIVEIL
jgi:hypothetical protein